MTSAQWLFHYLEVCKFKSENEQLEYDKVRSVVGELRDTMIFVASCIDSADAKKRSAGLIKELHKNDPSRKTTESDEKEILILAEAPAEIFVEEIRDTSNMPEPGSVRKRWLPKLEYYETFEEMSDKNETSQ